MRQGSGSRSNSSNRGSTRSRSDIHNSRIRVTDPVGFFQQHKQIQQQQQQQQQQQKQQQQRLRRRRRLPLQSSWMLLTAFFFQLPGPTVVQAFTSFTRKHSWDVLRRSITIRNLVPLDSNNTPQQGPNLMSSATVCASASSAVSTTTTTTITTTTDANTTFPNHINMMNNNNYHTNSAEASAFPIQPVRAKMVTAQDLPSCGERLRQGDLVAFPTETVYGLGCHALDESACRKVFAAKERPLTDPLIVHVNHAQEAYQLWQVTSDDLSSDSQSQAQQPQQQQQQAHILRTLCQAFWPGPLTLVARAASTVPKVVTAGTDYVAARSPAHPLARSLLAAAAVPVAAPSANKFGHVSPTTAQHVWDDLSAEDVWILQSSNACTTTTSTSDTTAKATTTTTATTTACAVGVESSVVKLQDDNTLVILRQGAVSMQDLQKALQEANLDQMVRVVARSNQRVTETTATVAPGQCIRHYSPNVPSYLVSAQCASESDNNNNHHHHHHHDAKPSTAILQHAVVMDYGQQCIAWKDHVLAYRDLSVEANSAQAAQGVYESLRWAEQVPHAKYILFPSLDTRIAASPSDALLLAVQDRLTRAASGVVLDSLQALTQSSQFTEDAK